MDEQIIEVSRDSLSRTPTMRDIAWVCFRHQQLIVRSFVGIILCLVIVVLISPKQYEAEVEILLKSERADPVVTPGNDNVSRILTAAITEEDINSEVELLKSRDLLEKVVVTCGLDRQPNHSTVLPLHQVVQAFGRLSESRPDLVVPLAVQELQRHLKVEPIKKSNLIQITYSSRDPQRAANVLKTLTDLYLEKHMEVRRPPGTFDFFQQQTSRYWQVLQAAQQRLAEYNRTEGTVSAETEKAAAEQKLAEFGGALRQTRSAIAGTKDRIGILTKQIGSTPDRLTTEIHTSVVLLQQLKSTLLTLELKRSELAGKYASNYRPLLEVEAEIARTKAKIADEQNIPSHEDTTDRNPTYQWMADELPKAKADLASLQGQAAAIELQIRAYRSELLDLDRKSFEQQDLIRTVKTEEASYLLYLNKREEARISDALDQKHILNVAIAEAATVPALPTGRSPTATLLIGLVMAGFISVGLAFTRNYLDASFRSPDDVTLVLDIPLLASFPKANQAARRLTL